MAKKKLALKGKHKKTNIKIEQIVKNHGLDSTILLFGKLRKVAGRRFRRHMERVYEIAKAATP